MCLFIYETPERPIYQERSTFEVCVENVGDFHSVIVRCKGVREDDGSEVEYFIQDVLEVVSVKSGKDGKVYAFPNSVNRLLPAAKNELAAYINSDLSIEILEEV